MSELAAIVQRTLDLTAASGVSVGLTVNDGQEIECCASSGLTAPALGRAPLVEESLTRLCMSCGKQLRFDKTRTSPGAVVVTPIGREDKVIGVLAVFADTTDLFSELCLASLREIAAQITEILWDEYGPGRGRILIPAFTDVPATEASQPKPPASVRLPLQDRITEPALASEPRPEDAQPDDRKPVRTSLATLEALAAQPERSVAHKTLWLTVVAVVVVAGVATWAFRAKAKPLVPMGLHPSDAPAANISPALSLEPVSVTAQRSSTFSLNIILSRGQDVSSIPVLVRYDPVIMRLVSVSNGEFLSRGGGEAVLAHRNDPSSGTLRIHAQRLAGNPGLSGKEIAFHLVFVAMERGSGTVSIVPEARREDQTGNSPQAVARVVVTSK